MNHPELTEESRSYVREKSKSYRKNHGQFFTPRSLRKRILENIPDLESPGVLDPACGTGEFLLSARETFDGPDLEGWEIEEELVSRARQVVPEASVIRTDSLRREFQPRFDVVVGNPPYFEFQPEDALRQRYEDVLYGRVNAVTPFVKLAVESLRDGGWLGFVVPSSLNNGAYFSQLRRYLTTYTDIQYLSVEKDQKLFEGARQSVTLLILQKNSDGHTHSKEYVYERGEYVYFSPHAREVRNTLEANTTMAELDCTVRTGTVVWNENRDRLTNDGEHAVPLVWSANVRETGLEHPRDMDKPQYIRWEEPNHGPAVVVNRVTGAADRAQLRAGLVPDGQPFVAENHTNVIFPPPSHPSPVTLLKSIQKELGREDHLSTVRKITGNTQFSKTELMNLFPLDDRLETV